MDKLVRQDAVEESITSENLSNQVDSGCETSTIKSIEETLLTTTITTTEITTHSDDILILTRHPDTRRRLINKKAYAQLHRSLSPTPQLDSIKLIYETSDHEVTKSDTETTIPVTKREKEVVTNKSKLPVARTRQSVKSEIISPPKKTNADFKYRHSLILDRKSKRKDENSNVVIRKNSSSSGEITVIPRSQSIETVDKVIEDLNLFTMEKQRPKEKKRANSFKKLFSGRIFSSSKEKKKKEQIDSLQQNKNINNDNLQNESFSRQAPQRHSLGNSNIPKPSRIPQIEERKMPPPNVDMRELEKQYAQMHVKEFNNIKQNFENPDSPVESDKLIRTVNPGPMDFKKVTKINKFIDTSSSTSIDSDRDNSLNQQSLGVENSFNSPRFADNNRDTPPRAQELKKIQDVKLVSPKASIPINSERPLPNPYQNVASNKPKVSPKPSLSYQVNTSSLKAKSKSHFNFPENNNRPSKPMAQKYSPESDTAYSPQHILVETYGTVFDSLESKKKVTSQNLSTKLSQKPPRSPSLEPTKLKLPSNRDIASVSPRVKSPIPQHHVSAEKLIATELLRVSRSPTPTKKKNNQHNSSHQSHDQPDNFNIQRNQHVQVNHSLTSKPPISRTPEQYRNQPLSPTYENRNQPGIYSNSPETFTASRPSEYINIQKTYQLIPTYNQNQSTTPLNASQELVLIPMNHTNGPPTYENHIQFNGSQERIPLKSTEHILMQRSRQSPNYDLKNHFVNSQERLSRSMTPDHANIHRNSQLTSSSKENLLNTTIRSPTPNNITQNSRSSTPVDMRILQTSNQSPQKEDMRRSVEAYYWKEIKKLKEQENRDLYYYQVQMMPFGYAEDPISLRRSRSSSPSQRNGRRSLSLPREPKAQIQTMEVDGYGRFQPTPIPEGRAVVNYSNHYQQNFRRNTPERRTIEAMPRSNNSLYRPIFKRGSLTTPVRELVEDQQYKKVTFGSPQEDAWYARNGYPQNIPRRKVDVKRQESLDDEVFLPNQQQTSKLIVDGKEIYGYNNRPYNNQPVRKPEPQPYQNANLSSQIHQEPIYTSKIPMRGSIQEDPVHQEPVYASKILTRGNIQEDSTRVPAQLTRYNSIQLVGPAFVPHQRVSRRMSFDNTRTYIPTPQAQQNIPRRQIYIKDDVYGYFGGYLPNDQQNIVYSSRQDVPETVYGYNGGIPRQVTVRDKVCDIYGQIHETNSPSLQVRNSGVVIGQLQPVQSPPYPQVPNQHFVRNSRLTASANDMYRRYQNVDPRYSNNVIYEKHQAPTDAAPTRPLPPVPTDKKVPVRQTGEMPLEASDVENSASVVKSKKRGIFGNPLQSPQATEDGSINVPDFSPREILFKELHLIKEQKVLQLRKLQWHLERNISEIAKGPNCRLYEPRRIEDLSITDLKKLIFIEELELVNLKLRLELNV